MLTSFCKSVLGITVSYPTGNWAILSLVTSVTAAGRHTSEVAGPRSAIGRAPDS